MPIIQEHAKNILRLRKGEELLFWILHKIKEIFFSRPMFINATSSLISVTHEQICFRSFFIYCYIYN